MTLDRSLRAALAVLLFVYLQACSSDDAQDAPSASDAGSVDASSESAGGGGSAGSAGASGKDAGIGGTSGQGQGGVGGSGGAAGSAGAAGGSGQGGSAGASQPNIVFSEDWESGDGNWTIEGSAQLETDASHAHQGGQSLRVDFRNPECGPSSCNQDGNNCYENYPQVVSTGYTFDLARFYLSWWVYYPSDFTFYQGPCLPTRGMQGHFVRFSNSHTPHDPNDSFYQTACPDFGQYRADDEHLGIRAEWGWIENDTGQETIGRNLRGLPLAITSLAGNWNHYEVFVNLGAPGGFDGAMAFAVNEVLNFDLHADAVHVGSPLEDWDAWGSDEVKAHPGLFRSSPEGFTRLGLVSNPNSSFGGREGDVYWIDDVVLMDGCPSGSVVCAAAQ